MTAAPKSDARRPTGDLRSYVQGATDLLRSQES